MSFLGVIPAGLVPTVRNAWPDPTANLDAVSTNHSSVYGKERPFFVNSIDEKIFIQMIFSVIAVLKEWTAKNQDAKMAAIPKM